MGIVLGSFGAFQGNIWSVAPFIPVGPGEKGSKKAEKCDIFSGPQSFFFKNCIKPLLYMYIKGLLVIFASYRKFGSKWIRDTCL